jgi:predicted DNA-binding transcriptional regulator AlpA
VKAGVLPKPIKLGRSSLWNVADVLQALEQRGMK